ncbi:hypothetical protein C8R46DRAFT_651594 [Mycena filopes]|nr:hypothetical protein C8R46DRAFT_651594 [Mycena filopes]
MWALIALVLGGSSIGRKWMVKGSAMRVARRPGHARSPSQLIAAGISRWMQTPVAHSDRALDGEDTASWLIARRAPKSPRGRWPSTSRLRVATCGGVRRPSPPT